MDEFDLSGTYPELGRTFAAALDSADRSPAAVSPETVPPPSEDLAFARDCVPHVEEHAPGLLDELDAVADGLDADRETLRAIVLALDTGMGCSLVGVSGAHTATGNPLFGRNHDYRPSTREYAKLYRTRPDDGYGSVGCSLNPVGRNDGVNEAGLAVAFSGVPCDEREPGVMFPLAVRRVLDGCATVDEAVAVLEAMPHAFNVNFLVADASGDLAVVEASTDAVETTRPDDGVAVATNQFASASMLEHQAGDRTPADCHRYATIDRWTDAGELDLEGLRTVMGDPDAGVCWRLKEAEDDPRSTLWSWTAELGSGVAHLARDSPAETSYEPVALPESGGA